MKIRDLIKKLKEYPGYLDVVILDKHQASERPEPVSDLKIVSIIHNYKSSEMNWDIKSKVISDDFESKKAILLY